jgi:nitroreductase
MNVIDAMSARYTVRAFTSDPIDTNMLQKILEAALLAPS